MSTTSRQVLLALALFAMPGASACVATGSTPRAQQVGEARVDLGSEEMIAFWECTSR